MSDTLKWAPTQTPKGDLPDDLKTALFNGKYRGHDYIILDKNKDIGYIEGLIDGKIRGSIDLYKILNEHENIRLWRV